KSLFCISCWNKYNSESYALWKIYSGMDKGIMITSNIELLKKAFENTTEKVQLNEVLYIDYEKGFIPPNNINNPVLCKNIAYSYEEEIRLIYCLLGTGKVGNGLIYDWGAEKNEFGKYLKIDLNILIDEIILSPYAPIWFYDMIQDLLQKYDLDKKIKFSKLK